MSLKIYDGGNLDLFVELDDGVTTAIARGGWKQSGPDPQPGNIWNDVEETVRVALLTEDNGIYQALMALHARAEAVQSPGHPDHMNPGGCVVVEAQTPDEEMPRYALVRSIRVERLDAAHYRANGRNMLEVTFVREGLWRGIAPGEAPLVLYHDDYWDRVTMVDIVNDTAPMFGDAPPLLLVEIGSGYGGETPVLALTSEAFHTGAEPVFPTMLWVDGGTNEVDISSLGSPFNSADALPGVKCLPTAGTYRTRNWDITPYRAGNYSVYGLFLCDIANGATAQFINGSLASGEELPIGTVNTVHWSVMRLGTFRLPPTDHVVRGAAPPDHTIGVKIKDTTAQAYLGGVILVPEPEIAPQIVTLQATISGSPRAVVDGEIEWIYYLLPNNTRSPLISAIPSGPYQSLTPGPGITNRIYVLPTSGTEADSVLPPINTTARLTIRYIPRWQYLNPVTPDDLPEIGPPTVTIFSGPVFHEEGDPAVFYFKADQPDCLFECRLDAVGAEPWVECSSPESFTGLTAGDHSFEIRATNQTAQTSEVVFWYWETTNGGPA